MKTKISRRGLIAASISAGAGVAVAGAQTAPTQADMAKVTREQNQRAGDVLAKFEIPLATEPAFQFKA
jgi:hypothetical protein